MSDLLWVLLALACEAAGLLALLAAAALAIRNA